MRNTLRPPRVNPPGELLGAGIRHGSMRNMRNKSPVTPLIAKSSQQNLAALRNMSPFKKITSQISIYKNTLPGFLQCSDVEKIETKQEERNLGYFSPRVMKINIFDEEQFSKAEIWNQVKQYIFNRDRNYDGFVLRKGNIELQIDDLVTLLPGKEVAENVINVCLKLIKKKNKKKNMLHTENIRKVYIFTTEEAKSIFGDTGMEFKYRKNLQRFE
jgi:hypothetical protein